jgi:hypothetical protein
MMTKRSSVAALVGLIFLLLPIGALAGHDHDDGDESPDQSWHDHGKHKGWYKHPHDRDEEEESAPLPRVVYPDRPAGWWSNGHRVCDRDGDNCRVSAPEPLYRPNWERRYVCDGDRDDCHWTGGAERDYWRDLGGYDYGAPFSWYEAPPPSAYSAAQQRDWLISRRQHALLTIKRMRDRGDSKAAGRLADALHGLNVRINSLDRQVGGGYDE